MQTFQVRSTFKTYDVVFTRSLAKELRSISSQQPTHLLIDSRVHAHHEQLFHAQHFASKRVYVARERYKNLTGIDRYCQYLLSHNAQKGHMILVVGGGLVQDIGSFSAHILKRGMQWVFVPSTLLSMADSCIGGKSGINVGKHKNQVGAFHPPSRIVIHPQFLATLSPQDRINGIGEILKHALIKGGSTYKRICDLLPAIPKDVLKTEQCITLSLMIKKEIVETDELDNGMRKLLNYGHTFGHALEGYTNNSIPHGLGVLIGMDMANYISFRRGLVSKNEFESISREIWKYIPIVDIPVVSVSRFMKFLLKDKKAEGDAVQALLCTGIGRVVIKRVSIDRQLAADIRSYIQRVRENHI